MSQGRLLLAAERRFSTELLLASLEEAGFEIECVTPPACLRELERGGAYDALVLDLTVPSPAAAAMVEALRRWSPDVPVIAIVTDDAPASPGGVCVVARSPRSTPELAKAVEAAVRSASYGAPAAA